MAVEPTLAVVKTSARSSPAVVPLTGSEDTVLSTPTAESSSDDWVDFIGQAAETDAATLHTYIDTIPEAIFGQVLDGAIENLAETDGDEAAKLAGIRILIDSGGDPFATRTVELAAMNGYEDLVSYLVAVPEDDTNVGADRTEKMIDAITAVSKFLGETKDVEVFKRFYQIYRWLLYEIPSDDEFYFHIEADVTAAMLALGLGIH